MHRLSGTDSGFLAMESPWQPMFNVAHAVLAPGPYVTLNALADHLAGRLDQVPSFRRRVVAVPGGLHHPVALDDPDFELSDHLAAVSLSDPEWHGLTLDDVVARLAEEPMPQDRPLWRAYLVDGVEGGRQAIVLHFHHAIGDGTAAMAMFGRIFSSDELAAPAEAAPYAPRSIPGRVALVLGALGRHLVSVVAFIAAVLGAVGGLRRVRARKDEASVEVPPISEGAPRTVLNDAFTPERACLTVNLSLAGLRHVRRESGATLNDVVLGIVSGGLRRYLLETGALPERSLLCNMPMSDEPADAPERTSGNNFWSVTTSLATDIEDPLERLAAISAVAQECKEQLRAFGVGTVPALLDVVPPALLARGTRRVGERLREASEDVDANVLVSNVRGASAPYVLLGRTVSEIYVCGPPSNGIGCNISVMSYGDTMLFTVLAYADALRDPAGFGAALEASFAELAERTGWVSPERASA